MAAAPLGDAHAEFVKTTESLTYKQQAVFFLNAYWKEHGTSAEEVWKINDVFQELEEMNTEPKTGVKKRGKSLDEMQSAKVFERLETAITVIERRKLLKKIDVDTDNRLALLEYVLYRFKGDVETLMERPQGVSKALEAAEAKVEAVRESIKKVKKMRGKWEGKPVPEEGSIKRMSYEQDMKVLGDMEKNLEQELDLAKKKLKAAERSSDTVAQGKIWWMNRELEEMAKFARPKKKVLASAPVS